MNGAKNSLSNKNNIKSKLKHIPLHRVTTKKKTQNECCDYMKYKVTTKLMQYKNCHNKK